MTENTEDKEIEQEERKVKAIRGIDERLYREIAKISREIGWTIGEIINYSLRLFLESFPEVAEKLKKSTREFVITPTKEFLEAAREAMESDKTKTYLITDLEEVFLSKKDLEGLDKPLSIHSVRRLVISEDVDFELFNSKITSISFVDEVIVPKTYPKVPVYTKLKAVKKVTFA